MNRKIINPSKTVIFAFYNKNAKIGDDVLFYLKELKKCFTSIFFIADCKLNSNEKKKIKFLVDYVYCKRHRKYDFGSYQIGYKKLRNLKLIDKVDELLLCNDSVIGPIFNLKEIVNKMNENKCDFWGLVGNPSPVYHLQSWFLYFKHSIIASNKLYDFLKTVKKEKYFSNVVKKYELCLTRFLIKNGFVCSDYINCDDDVFNKFCCKIGDENILVNAMSFLISDYNFPFIKKKALLGVDYKFDSNTLNVIKKNNLEVFKLINDFIAINKMNMPKSLEDLIRDCKIISFDLFDTLLIRPFLKPTDLFIYIEKKYNLPRFYEYRLNAEKNARIFYKEYEEIDLNQIYSFMPKSLSKGYDIELFEESKFLKVHPNNFKLYELAKKYNKKIIVITDVYLPEKFISEVLKKNKISVDYLYVSSKYKICKYSGNLYIKVLKDFARMGISAKDFVHIGDNNISDVVIPKKLKMNAVLVKSYVNEFLDEIGNLKFKTLISNVDSFNLRTIISICAFKQIFNYKNYWDFLGYSLGGPLSYGYVNYIIKNVKKLDIRNLFFVSRDGFVLKKIFDKYNKNLFVNSYYIPFGREISISCMTVEEIICNSTYLNEFLLIKSKLLNLSLETKKDLIKYKEKINKIALRNQSVYKKSLSNFLKNSNFDKIASIDSGSGQRSSSCFFKKIYNEKFICGFYTFLSQSDFNSELSKTFCLTANNSNFESFEILCELMLTAPTPSIKELNGDKILYNNETHFITNQKFVSQVLDGEVSFCNDIKEVFGDFDFNLSFNEIKIIFDYFINIPNLFDLIQLKKYYHEYDHINKKSHSLSYYLFYDKLNFTIDCSDCDFNRNHFAKFKLIVKQILKFILPYSLGNFLIKHRVKIKSKFKFFKHKNGKTLVDLHENFYEN